MSWNKWQGVPHSRHTGTEVLEMVGSRPQGRAQCKCRHKQWGGKKGCCVGEGKGILERQGLPCGTEK